MPQNQCFAAFVTFLQCCPAESKGFEPLVRLSGQRFSRPPRSTTPATLRRENTKIDYYLNKKCRKYWYLLNALIFLLLRANLSNMGKSSYKSELILLFASVVWGFTFVAQKAGMDDIGPMAFNGIRFLIGSLSLVPVIFLYKEKQKKSVATKNDLWKAGFITGIVMFLAATTQQLGIVYTNAGNAGFITSFYVILVPIFGMMFFKHKIAINTWFAAIIAMVGLYFLSVADGFVLSIGDLLVFGSAFFWAFQVLLAGYYAPRLNVIKLAAIQFAVTGIISLVVSFFTETYGPDNIVGALLPILYGGLMSVGLAFTLQLIGQQKANPSHAAIILSLESVFAAIGGWLILHEAFTISEKIGAALMLTGVIVSQIRFSKKVPKHMLPN